MTGLSPRVRGNRNQLCGHSGRDGSIPACAGEPVWAAARSSSASVYPRVCGGTWRRAAQREGLPGLSPRVRGNPTRCGPMPDVSRSIPACAGEPYRVSRTISYLGVYPRVCGGTSPQYVHLIAAAGLSPRVRGNLVGGFLAFARERSIPACAGEPRCTAGVATGCAVYPRVCGGTTGRWYCSMSPEGLSPRVRGNPSPP